VFDFLGCRSSAYHWRDFEAGLRETQRILKSGAMTVFIDVVAPGYAMFDTHPRTIEMLRDPWHISDYTASEWTSALDRAQFRVWSTKTRRSRLDYAAWVERMRTLEPRRAAIRSLLRHASDETIAYYATEAYGSFTHDTLRIEASACRARM
jgi:ubiquinone/menaquinone biosynthesis C-methylase UbiE